MNPFSTSLHSTFNVGRSKFNVLSLFLLTVTIAPAQPNRDEQDSEVVIVPGGHSILRWYGHPNRSYFIQVSDQNDPLGKWNWAPLIEAGNGAEISHQIGGIADNAFFRLRYTGLTPGPGETLDTADFDGDGLSNIDEIKPPFPITATDPLDPESDKDGLPDGWERSFAAGMLALGAPPGHWGANGAALQSGNLDPNATLQDDGMTIREIYNSTTTPDDYQMILHDLFIQAKRAQFGFAVSHDSITTEEGGPPVNQGGGGFSQGSGFGRGTIETWSRSIFSSHVLDVQLDPFSVTPDTSLAWFNNESQYVTWTYHTHWIEAFDPNPRTLFPIEEMANSSYAFKLTHGGRSDYSQFQATGPFVAGQSTTATLWSGVTYKSKFRLYRPRPTSAPVDQSFLKVTTERQLEMKVNGNVIWSDAPPTTTVEAIQATIPAFGHTSPWIETTPQAVAQKSRTVDLHPVEVVDKDKCPVSELTVADMEDSLNEVGELYSDPGLSPRFDGDPDRFYIRIAGLTGSHDVSVELSTIENPDATYNDDATEIKLKSKNGGFESESQILVSGAIDAEISTANAITEQGQNASSKHQRTHNIQLDGKVRITNLKIDGVAIAMDMKVPVPVKKTVSISAVVFSDAGTPNVAAEVKSANEIFASTGVKIVLSGAPSNQPPPAPVFSHHALVSAVEMTDVSDWGRFISNFGSTNTMEDIHVFYVLGCKYNGFAAQGGSIIERTPGTTLGPPGPTAAQTGDANNVFISQSHADFVTLAHELAHVLTNAGHYGTDTGLFDYDANASNLKESHNLMSATSRSHSEVDRIIARKRIYENQRKTIVTHRCTK